MLFILNKYVCRLTIPNWHRFCKSNQYAPSLTLYICVGVCMCVLRINCQRLTHIWWDGYECYVVWYYKYALPQWKVYRPHIFTTITKYANGFFLFGGYSMGIYIYIYIYAILRWLFEQKKGTKHVHMLMFTVHWFYSASKWYIGINIFRPLEAMRNYIFPHRASQNA